MEKISIHRNQIALSFYDHGMPPTAEADNIPAPAPSFNDFSFKQIGMAKPSLFARLNMFSQPEPPLAPPALESPPPEMAIDGPAPLTSESTQPALAIDTTATSSLLSGHNVPIGQGSAVVREAAGPNQPGPALAPDPILSASTSAMEVDELIDSDVVEFIPVRETNPTPRIPETYRALSADHYFVAPPASLPYPRSPVLRFSEGHPLYVAPSLFAHLPRAPPRSPRLDPLAILELESERERSEWDQVRKDLVRPSPDLFSTASTSITSPEVSLPAPTPISVPPVLTSAETSSPVLAPAAPSETGYDSDSSGVELRIYDNVPPSEADAKEDTETDLAPPRSPTSNLNASTARTSPPPNSKDPFPAKPLNPATSATAQKETSVAANLPIRRFTPNRLSPAGEVLLPKPSAPDSVQAGPAAPIVNDEQTGSPERVTTPAKRKFDATEDPAGKQGNDSASTATSRQASLEAGRGRLGVPPPFRAQVENVPVAKPTSAESSTPFNPFSVKTISKLNNTLSTNAPQYSSFGPQSSAFSTPGPQTSDQQSTERPICRFHNRPPGRVCIRKEACPDLHQGPLMKPLTVANYLFPAATPSANAFAARPLSSADRHIPPPCAFFFSVGCNRGAECPFSHDAASRETFYSTPHTAPLASAFPIVNMGNTSAQTQWQTPRTPSMPQSPPPTQTLRKDSQIPPPKPMAQVPQTRRAQSQLNTATTQAAPLLSQSPADGSHQTPIPQPQVQASSAVSQVSPGASVIPNPATPAPPRPSQQENGSTGSVKVKAEHPSPSLNSVKIVAPLPKKIRKAAQVASRRIKEELTLRAGEYGALTDEEMADGAAGVSNSGPILPTSISVPFTSSPSISAPVKLSPSQKKKARARARALETSAKLLVPAPAPASTSTSDSAATPAPATATAAARQPLPLPAKPSPSVISAAAAPPPPALMTVVIPPTPVPVRASTTKKAAPPEPQQVPPRKTPSPVPLPQPAQRQHSIDSRRPDPQPEPERRNSANRARSPPPRRVPESRLRADSYRPGYSGQVRGRISPSRSRSPLRSRDQSLSRSRSRSRSPPPMRRSVGNGNPTRHSWRMRSPSPGPFGRYEDRRFLARPGYRPSSRSRSPEGRRYPSISSQNGRDYDRRASPPFGGYSHWSSRSPISRSPISRSPASRSPISRSPSPVPPSNVYRGPNYEDRGQARRSAVNNWSPRPRTRSPLPQLDTGGNHGYGHGGNSHPSEAEMPRVWEMNARQPSPRPGQVRDEGNTGTNRNVQGNYSIIVCTFSSLTQ